MFYHKKGHKEKVLWKKQKDDKVKNVKGKCHSRDIPWWDILMRWCTCVQKEINQ